MNMDFENSLTYITKDEHWVKKLFAGAGLLCLSFLIYSLPFILHLIFKNQIVDLISTFLSIVISLSCIFLISGFFCRTTYNRINNKEEIMPCWTDVCTLMKDGAKYFFGYFLYTLPLIIICGIITILLIFGLATTGFDTKISEIFSQIFVAFLFALGIFAYLVTIIFLPLMMTNFCKSLKVLSFIDLKNGFELLKGNIINYCILLILFMALSVIAQILCTIMVLTVIGIIFTPVLYLYGYLVVADLIAQFAKSKQLAPESNDTENQNENN